mmetsp:Transcript_10527/g.64595  ORF Transcript_10527/g.64595 Transcript_10527/m.64595 type:complete len:266 (-) Transcript_10527:2338-3135(-)
MPGSNVSPHVAPYARVSSHPSPCFSSFLHRPGLAGFCTNATHVQVRCLACPPSSMAPRHHVPWAWPGEPFATTWRSRRRAGAPRRWRWRRKGRRAAEGRGDGAWRRWDWRAAPRRLSAWPCEIPTDGRGARVGRCASPIRRHATTAGRGSRRKQAEARAAGTCGVRRTPTCTSGKPTVCCSWPRRTVACTRRSHSSWPPGATWDFQTCMGRSCSKCKTKPFRNRTLPCSTCWNKTWGNQPSNVPSNRSKRRRSPPQASPKCTKRN